MAHAKPASQLSTVVKKESEDSEGSDDEEDEKKAAASAAADGAPKKKTHLFHKRRQEKRAMLVQAVESGEDVPYLAAGHFILEKRHYFNQKHAKIQCCTLHRSKEANLLVVGFSDGVFGLYELPDFNNIHTLSYVFLFFLF